MDTPSEQAAQLVAEEKKTIPPTQPHTGDELPRLTHPKITDSDAKAHRNILRFQKALEDTNASRADVEEAYKDAWVEAQTSALSEAAFGDFAHACYAYWEAHLPTLSALRAARATDVRLRAQWRGLAEGRVLYRQWVGQGKAPRYYW